jgi:hypothetical protein
LGGAFALDSFKKPEVSDQVLFFPADAAESSVIHQGITYWRDLKGPRRFPARGQVTLRGLNGLAKHTSLIRVIDGGSDYEFRFIGDVPVFVVGWNFQGRRMSEPEVAAVMQANYRHLFYARVVETGEPWLFKRRMMHHSRLKLPVHSETAYFPLGDDDAAVDHLLGFTVFAAEAG